MFSSLASICLGMVCPSPCLSFSITKARVLMYTILVFLFQILNFGHLHPFPIWEPLIFFPQIGFYQIVINSTCILLLLLVGWGVYFVQRAFAHFSSSMRFLSISQVSPIRSVSQATETSSVFQKPKVEPGVCSFASFWGVLRAHVCIVWCSPFHSSLLSVHTPSPVWCYHCITFLSLGS